MTIVNVVFFNVNDFTVECNFNSEKQIQGTNQEKRNVPNSIPFSSDLRFFKRMKWLYANDIQLAILSTLLSLETLDFGRYT